MISEEMRELLATGSDMRKIWEDSFRLKRIHGADNVADMTLGNPVAPPPDGVGAGVEGRAWPVLAVHGR